MMEPISRSVSCPASLDVTTHANTLIQLGEVIEKNPGSALIPILPPFHAAVVRNETKWEKNTQACEALQEVFGQIPFIMELAQIPGLFAKEFPDKKLKIKHLAIRVLDQDPKAPYEVIQKHIQLVRQAHKEKNIWSDIVDKFIGELNEGRKSKEIDDHEVTNPVSFFLKISLKKLASYLTSTSRLYKYPIDKLFENYGISRRFAKTLIMPNIRNFMMAAVEKSDTKEQFKKEREVFAQMVYEIVDQFLFEAQHMLVYRKCLTVIVKKVHGEDMEDDEVKTIFLNGLECLLEDIARNKKIMDGVQVGMSRLDYLLPKKV